MFWHVRFALSLLCTAHFFLSGCDSPDEPIQARPIKPLNKAPEITDLTRQMTQIHAERRSLHQELVDTPGETEMLPTASEEEMRQAGEIIRDHYRQLGRMPKRPEMIKLLTKKMKLGAPPQDELKARAILDMMMLD